MVMPAIGTVGATHGSPIVNWTAGGANMTFPPVWPSNTKIVIGDGVYWIASVVSTGQLTLSTNFSATTGKNGYNVDSYVEITGGESLDNGQRSRACQLIRMQASRRAFALRAVFRES
jgi:hypothetical protein